MDTKIDSIAQAKHTKYSFAWAIITPSYIIQLQKIEGLSVQIYIFSKEFIRMNNN